MNKLPSAEPALYRFRHDVAKQDLTALFRARLVQMHTLVLLKPVRSHRCVQEYDNCLMNQLIQSNTCQPLIFQYRVRVFTSFAPILLQQDRASPDIRHYWEYGYLLSPNVDKTRITCIRVPTRRADVQQAQRVSRVQVLRDGKRVGFNTNLEELGRGSRKWI